MGELREDHVRVSQTCSEKLQEIAEEDEVPIATVFRQALWQYVRRRVSDEGALAHRPPQDPQ